IVFSMSRGAVASIPLDGQQELELLMTIGQALVGLVFLVNMVLEWWEAAFLFVLWAVQFAFSAVGINFTLAGLSIHWLITIVYFAWAGWELLRILAGRRKPAAFIEFA